MIPWFVLSYPRSRTAWLATYLTGGGVFAFHEAWKLVRTVKDLRVLMASKAKGGGPVVNVDCGNWFFLADLQAEFPEARYVLIQRPWPDVEQSSRESFGEGNYQLIEACYHRAMSKSRIVPDIIVDFDRWTPDESLRLWAAITSGAPMDPHWHRQTHDCLVQLMPEAIAEELAMGQRGELQHITARMITA